MLSGYGQASVTIVVGWSDSLLMREMLPLMGRNRIEFIRSKDLYKKPRNAHILRLWKERGSVKSETKEIN